MAFAGYPPPEHLLGDLGMEAELTTEPTGPGADPGDPVGGGARRRGAGRGAGHPGRHRRRRHRRPGPATRLDGHRRPLRSSWSDRRSAPGWRPAARSCGGAGPPWSSRRWWCPSTRTGTRPRSAAVPADPVAWASMTFAVLPARNPALAGDHAGGRPADAVGVRRRGARPAGPRGAAGQGPRRCRRPGVGPVPALSPQLVRCRPGRGDRPAGRGGRGRGPRVRPRARDGSGMVVTDLQIAYLALGRVGPIVSSARVLAAGPDGRRSRWSSSATPAPTTG